MEDAALIGRLQNAGWRALLLPLLDTDKAARDAAYVALEQAVSGWERGDRKDLNLSGEDLPLLIEIGMTVKFSAANDWSQPAHKFLFAFVRIITRGSRGRSLRILRRPTTRRGSTRSRSSRRNGPRRR
jgi:hypothetical protein